jgi:VanZ family protein
MGMPGRAALWLPPLALMALIFALSAQPNLSSGLGLLDHVGRKLVHMAEFGLLCALWWRALRTVAPGPRALAAAWTVAVLYAVSDEWHQSFVTGRTGSPWDVLIDAAGASIAAALVARRPRAAALGPRA